MPATMIVHDVKRELKMSEYVEYKGTTYRRISVNEHMIRWEYDSYFMYMSIEMGIELEKAYGARVAANEVHTHA